MIVKYSHKRIWKVALFSMAVLIGVASIVYTNYVVKKLAKEERERIKLTVDATKLITKLEPDNQALSFLSEILQGNTTTPVIVTDTLGRITQHRNLDSLKALDSAYLYDKLNQMKSANEPIRLETEYSTEIFHYGDSSTIIMLKYYPYLQLFIIALFILVSYWAFSSSRRFEQNQVWVGMSKETAHQLGTPLSSLMAWVEYLRGHESAETQSIAEEIAKDVKRLETVTERFSKIGSKPELSEQLLYPVVEDMVIYLQRRFSKSVHLNIASNSETKLEANISRPLFEWVIENLCKNAVDAMSGKGEIIISLYRQDDSAVIDVKDNGKGIPIYLQKTVFNPGYTTRKRGWGLGLSLAQRIIETYHHGKIFVQQSEQKKGTTFRIKLPLIKA